MSRSDNRLRRICGVAAAAAAAATFSACGTGTDDAVDEVESDVPGEPPRDDPGQGVVPEVDPNGGSNDGLGLDVDELDPREGAAD